MHPSVFAVFLLVTYCEARPSFDFNDQLTSSSGSSYIIGGEDAKPGEFPWQLSQQYLNGTWKHSCGASLLSPRYALGAAHCVDGRPAERLRIVAGVIDWTSTERVTSYVVSYKMHESYKKRGVLFSDDIAIYTLASPIYANGVTIQYATLPDTNDNLFVGAEGVITGWGRIGESSAGSQILQKARIGVIDTVTCQQMLLPFNETSFRVDDTQICLFEDSHERTACNGDSGGPFNLDRKSGEAIVAGLSSWSPKGPNRKCLPEIPTMYTRTSAYLDWIKTNTP